MAIPPVLGKFVASSVPMVVSVDGLELLSVTLSITSSPAVFLSITITSLGFCRLSGSSYSAPLNFLVHLDAPCLTAVNGVPLAALKKLLKARTSFNMNDVSPSTCIGMGCPFVVSQGPSTKHSL